MQAHNLQGLLLLLLGLIGCCVVAYGKQEESVVHDEINKHLSASVKNSNDPLTNLNQTKIWAAEICDKYDGRDGYSRYYDPPTIGSVNTREEYVTLCKSLKDLSQMPDILANRTMCDHRGLNILIRQDSYLEKARSSEGGNLPYGRVDRIIEHIAFNWVESCQSKGVRRPELRYVFKTRAYDEINKYLIDNVNSADIDLNMAKVGEWKDLLIQDQVEEGVMVDALRQLLSMKSVTDEKMCNFKGYEIVLKNDLATGGSAHTNKLARVRRIDKIVHYYSLKHATICPSIYKQRFGTLVKKLNETSRNQLLTLTSTYLLPQGTNFTGSENTTSGDEAKFYTPALISALDKTIAGDESLLQKFESKSTKVSDFGITPAMIRQHLSVVAANDTNLAFLQRVPDEISGEFVTHTDIVRGLFNSYILKPCQSYIDTVNKEVFRLLQHDELVYNMPRITKDDLKANPSFHIGRTTYEVCRFVEDSSPHLISTLIGSFTYIPGRRSIKDPLYQGELSLVI